MSQTIRKWIVDELKESFTGVSAGVLVDYQGLTSQEVSSFRFTLRKDALRMKVVKNRLALKALETTGISGMTPVFKGPIGIVWGGEDPTIGPRVISNWNKSNKPVGVKGGFLDGSLVSARQVDDLSKLPSKDQLRSQIAGLVVQPVQNIATLVNEVVAQVARAVEAVREKREKEAV